MRCDVGPRIDHRQITFNRVADDVAVGARAGHHAGIGRGDTQYLRVDADNFAGDDARVHGYSFLKGSSARCGTRNFVFRITRQHAAAVL